MKLFNNDERSKQMLGDNESTNDKVSFVSRMIKRENVGYLTKDAEDLRQMLSDIQEQHQYVVKVEIKLTGDWFDIRPRYHKHDPEYHLLCQKIFDAHQFIMNHS